MRCGSRIGGIENGGECQFRVLRVRFIQECSDHVYEAANGAEAIKVLESHDVQALFTDINMPVMTGTELLRTIAGDQRWKDLLRVIISTDGSEARRNEVADLNVRCYVEKPFRPEVMRDVLSSLSEKDPVTQ